MSHPPLPLIARVLSQAGVTMLAQLLADDPAAQVTALEAAPLPEDDAGARYERLRLGWQGPKGAGERKLLLKVLPERTWGETVNPLLPAPAEVLLVEGDLSAAISALIEDGTLAAGRRQGGRPAWLLSDDWSALPPAAPDRALLARIAALHALHWGAERVLDEVYPWLPRWSRWIEAQRPLLHGERAAAETEIAALLASPQGLLHGSLRAGLVRQQPNGEPLLPGWERVQAGPLAWELYDYLRSTGTLSAESLDDYLDAVRGIIPELSASDDVAFRRALEASARLYPLLEAAAGR